MPKLKKQNCRIIDDSVELSLDTSLYPEEPVYATCYIFMDQHFINLDLSKDKKAYKVNLTPKNGLKNKTNLKSLAGEFKNELVNNILRYKIAFRNQKLREFIVREALFFSQPQEEQKKAGRKLQEREKIKKENYGKD